MPLLDAYDVYEQLMAYWHETMHDDVFLIMHESWVGASKPRPTIEDKDRKLSEAPDLVIGSGKNAKKFKTDLIPAGLIATRYFAEEQARVDGLGVKADDATREVEEYIEEHGVEEGLLWEAVDDGRITKALTTARLKEAKREGPDPDEIAALEHALALFNAETAAKKAAKDAQGDRDVATLTRYSALTESDVKALVLDDKWHGAVSSRVDGLSTALVLELVARIKGLGERYGQTLGELQDKLAALDKQLAGHLAEMGVT